MRTYGQLFAVREFRALFAGQVVAAGAMTIQGLALSVLVYDRTGSPLLAAAIYLGGYVPQALGVIAFSAIADRGSPRALLVGTDVLRVVVFAALATGAMPVAVTLAVGLVSGLGYGAVGGIRFLLLTDMLPDDAFVLGRSTLAIAVGGMQIIGFAVGGSVLAAFGVLPALSIATALAAVAALIDRFGLQPRRSLGSGCAGVRASWAGNRAVLADSKRRRLLAGQWLPNGLIVGAEALYVPYAGADAPVLFVGAAAGMLVGDLVVGRMVPAALRPRAVLPLYLLLACPYFAFLAVPPIPVATGLVTVASVGFGATLCLQQQFAQALPRGRAGQAFSLASAGQLSTQGIAAWGAGAIAETVPSGAAMALLAGLSLLATAVIVRPSSDHQPSAVIEESTTDDQPSLRTEPVRVRRS